MVLDALARIEETLAAQRQPPPAVVIDRLSQALISIRSAVEKRRNPISPHSIGCGFKKISRQPQS